MFSIFKAAFGICILGTSFGWSSSVQTQLVMQYENTTLLNIDLINSTTYSWDLQLSKDEMSWAGSLVTIGALMGSSVGGFLMDKFGRRITLMALFVPYTIGWILVSLSLNPGIIKKHVTFKLNSCIIYMMILYE